MQGGFCQQWGVLVKCPLPCTKHPSFELTEENFQDKKKKKGKLFGESEWPLSSFWKNTASYLEGLVSGWRLRETHSCLVSFWHGPLARSFQHSE